MRIYDVAFTIFYLFLLLIEGFCSFSGALLQIQQQLISVIETVIIDNSTFYLILSRKLLTSSCIAKTNSGLHKYKIVEVWLFTFSIMGLYT